jgi:hypothetical protein
MVPAWASFLGGLPMRGQIIVIAIGALAVSIAAPLSARADTTTLVCSGGPTTITVVLDTARGVVTVTFPAAIDTNSSPPLTMPGSSSTNSAVFDANTISWNDSSAVPPMYMKWTLDRLSGKLQMFASQGAPFEQAAMSQRYIYERMCRVGTPQF